MVKNSGLSSHKIFYGWWIVAACLLLSLFVAGITNYCFTAFIDPIAAEFHWSYAEISLAASLRFIEVGLLAPVIGWLIDRWGIRKVAVTGCLIACIGLLLFSMMNSLLIFYLSFIIIGTGATSGAQPAVMTVVSKWFHKKVGLAIGIAIAGYGLSGLFLPIITSIIEQYGWRAAALTLMTSVFVISIPALIVLRNRPEDCGLLPDGDSTVIQTSSRQPVAENKINDAGFNLKQAIRSRVFWTLCFAFTIMYFIVSAVVTHIMPYLSSIGIDRQVSSFIAAGIPVMSIVGRIGFGFLSDKFNKTIITTITIFLICLTVLGFVFASQFGFLFVLIAAFVFGIGYGGGISMSGVIIREQFGKNNFGSIFGLFVGVSFIGNITGAPVAGWVYDHLNSYHIFWLIASGLAILSILLIQTIRSKPVAKNMKT